MNSYIALGYHCNHHCRCCPLSTYDRLHATLKLDEIRHIIASILHPQLNDNVNDLDKIKRNITVSGGEPFLNPEIFELLDILLSNDAHVTVLTNSTCLKEKEALDRLNQVLSVNPSRIDHFEIVTAIHSSDNKAHDWMTNCENSLWDSIEGIDNIISLGVLATIKIIISKVSILNLKNTVEYIDEHFPDTVAIQFCGMDYCGNAQKNKDDLMVTFEEAQPYIEYAIDYIEQRNSEKKEKNGRARKISIIEAPLCMLDPYYWKYYNISINEDKIYMAPNAVKDNVEVAKALCKCNANYKECKLCSVNKICPGCWESAYNIMGDILRPIKTK